MARRSRSSFSAGWLLAIAVVLAAVFAGGLYVFGRAGDPYRTAAPFDAAAYLENSNSLRGNVYRLEGEVTNVLGFSRTEGRLIAVRIDAKDDVVPMMIPAPLGHVNIQKGQKFRFLLEVTDKGILRARELTKA